MDLKGGRVRQKHRIKPHHALLSILSLVVFIFLATTIWNVDLRVPLMMGCVVAAIVALYLGFEWNDVLNGLIQGIAQSLEAILILLSLGMLISIWIASGTVPTLLYYGLNIIRPQTFLPSCFVLCSLVSMMMGAWGSIGSIGVAFLGIGKVLNIDDSIIVGAIVAGSYVGDKISPFSDGTNLAATVANADLFEMIKQMIKLIGSVYFICLIGYFALGYFCSDGNDAALIEMQIQPLQDILTESFQITPLAFIPLIIMLLCVFFKMPSLPSVIVGVITGGLQAVLLQKMSIAECITYATSGFNIQTESMMINSLLNVGGIESMLWTISFIIIAMGYAGLMQKTGQIHVLADPILRRIQTKGGLVATTIVGCVVTNIILPDQYLGISVPGQMVRTEYLERKMSPMLLGNVLGAGAAVTSALIPWNTCGIYVSTVLNVSTYNYGKYALFNILLPLAVVAYGFIVIGKQKDE